MSEAGDNIRAARAARRAQPAPEQSLAVQHSSDSGDLGQRVARLEAELAAVRKEHAALANLTRTASQTYCNRDGCVFQATHSNMRGGEHMETITQGASGPVAVVGKSDGPYWSALDAASTGIGLLNYMGQSRTDNALFSHFVRDSIERRSDAAELRHELRELRLRDREPAPTPDPTNAVLAAALVEAIKALSKPGNS